MNQKKVWIDLDNSPHVPFFKPIVRELKKEGYSVVLTARDCFQTCGLADLHQLKYKRIGQHYGRNKLMKLIGVIVRAFQMLPTIVKEKPDIALSHGARAQVILASMLRVPSVVIFDYEFAKTLPFFYPNWLIMPEILSRFEVPVKKENIFTYPGIKEDVYVPYFKPDPEIAKELKLNGQDIIVTVRPPATEAHYFVPQSEKLFEAAIDFLLVYPNTKVILLPRNKSQEGFIRQKWAPFITEKRIIVPDRVFDGLNLLWHSDLVVSGGGTMNREAAALGVPVYSIFRGKIGAVDNYLSKTGRLVLIENVWDLKSQIVLCKRVKGDSVIHNSVGALESIVNAIITIMNKSC